MHVDVIACVNEARSNCFSLKTAVVIDVLRTTSTVITALFHGAAGVIPVETVPQAKSIKQENVILGGERFSRKIPGFDAGNSPYEYMSEDVINKFVVLTTSNGTRAIHKSLRASKLLLGGFINARACASALLALRKDIIIMCAGNQDEFAIEDGLCAGMIIKELIAASQTKIKMNDLGTAMYYAFLGCEDQLYHVILGSAWGHKMEKMGLAADVEYCCGLNQVPIVPILDEDFILRSM
ncbi:2-phosphosulfolactate phosphatase [Paenibacillus sediminis]|uniref:Probable 2-phosphosulfolactate phosphatase n=1 Tax=Paenibacillus sediminis TaxID=664909 RepID=A0ABS4H036_9BACL|nr:2-phosphosulfolactate phosphatase [Paenibacillus sediminis]MBP1935647.1 2-phosphosulfolactate phosphatase [Paenibacillus sediminis]